MKEQEQLYFSAGAHGTRTIYQSQCIDCVTPTRLSLLNTESEGHPRAEQQQEGGFDLCLCPADTSQGSAKLRAKSQWTNIDGFADVAGFEENSQPIG